MSNKDRTEILKKTLVDLEKNEMRLKLETFDDYNRIVIEKELKNIKNHLKLIEQYEILSERELDILEPLYGIDSQSSPIEHSPPKNTSKQNDNWSTYTKVGTATLIGGAAAVTAAPVLIAVAGFTKLGVAAGSIAAAIQSSIGSVTAGGLFASLQSAGVLGLGTVATAATATGGAATGAGIAGLHSKFSK